MSPYRDDRISPWWIHICFCICTIIDFGPSSHRLFFKRDGFNPTLSIFINIGIWTPGSASSTSPHILHKYTSTQVPTHPTQVHTPHHHHHHHHHHHLNQHVPTHPTQVHHLDNAATRRGHLRIQRPGSLQLVLNYEYPRSCSSTLYWWILSRWIFFVAPYISPRKKRFTRTPNKNGKKKQQPRIRQCVQQ